MTEPIQEQIQEAGWGQLPMWVVYDHPSDYPDHYVARQHIVTAEGDQPTSEVLTATDLSELRAYLSGHGLVQLDRNPEDDPVIVEVWL